MKMPLRPVNREQAWLLPPALDELLAQDHPARFVAAFVDGLPRDAWSEMEIDLDGARWVRRRTTPGSCSTSGCTDL